MSDSVQSIADVAPAPCGISRRATAVARSPSPWWRTAELFATSCLGVHQLRASAYT